MYEKYGALLVYQITYPIIENYALKTQNVFKL